MIVAPPTAPTRWKEAPNKRKQLHCTKDSFPPAGPTPPPPQQMGPRQPHQPENPPPGAATPHSHKPQGSSE